jgi:gas vesicle protein
MISNNESKFPYFLAGIGLGAIGGLLFAPRSGEETRKDFHERGTKALDILNQQVRKLRESAEGIVQQGKQMMNANCCAVDTVKDAEKVHEEDRR